MGIQYYYLGNLDKSHYYNDRAMRGKCEKKDSRMRELHNGINKQKRNSHRVTFNKVREIMESFAKIKEGVSKLVKSSQRVGEMQEP